MENCSMQASRAYYTIDLKYIWMSAISFMRLERPRRHGLTEALNIVKSQSAIPVENGLTNFHTRILRTHICSTISLVHCRSHA
jgi:hypothetical protein